MYIMYILYAYLICLLNFECDEECINLIFFYEYIMEYICVVKRFFFLPGAQNT